MKHLHRRGPVLDRLGVLVSGVCAIHCLAAPWILGAFSASGVLWFAGTNLETIVPAAAFVLAASSLVPAYLRHRNIDPIQLFLAGAVFLGAARIVPTGPAHWFCTLGLAAGGGLIAAAHLLNARLRSLSGDDPRGATRHP